MSDSKWCELQNIRSDSEINDIENNKVLKAKTLNIPIIR